MSQNYTSQRQQTPPNRSAFYAGIVVVVALLAGGVGWLASVMVNGPDDTDRIAENRPEDDPPENGGESRKSGDESDSDFKKEESKASTDKDSAAERKTSEEPEALRGKKASDRESPSEPGKIPKLSDLSSYKKNPTRDRVKIPSTKRTNDRSKIRSKDEKSSRIDIGPFTGGKSRQKRAEESGSTPETTSETTSDKSNRFAFPNQATPVVLFQELIIDRNPVFSMEGFAPVNQKFKYRVVSRLSVGPQDEGGFRKVEQKVVDASLLSADSLSRKSIAESVKKLIGREFRFTLDRKQQLVDFEGKKEKPKTVDLKDLTGLESLIGDVLSGEGFMVSSVMDLDGWKEMAQLTFLLPDDDKKKWTGQMEHDWGDLGRWVGETEFEKKSTTGNRLTIAYAHQMRYEAAKKKSGLPFELASVTFKSDEAGGRLQFDTDKRRIVSLQERFQVDGQMTAALLGRTSRLRVKEVQSFELKLHDQLPAEQ